MIDDINLYKKNMSTGKDHSSLDSGKYVKIHGFYSFMQST